MLLQRHFPMVHITTELGEQTVGGVGTCINELMSVSGDNTGFVHLSQRREPPVIEGGVIRAGFYDVDVLQALSFDTVVFHHYGLAYLADPSFLRGRKLVFAVHSVPTTEPWTLEAPYGSRGDIARSFEACCSRADAIVCVSEAEKGKLMLLYPELAERTTVIPNGFSSIAARRKPLSAERRHFGFLGRADYRKNLLELVRVFRSFEGTLRVACGEEDPAYAAAVRGEAERVNTAAASIRWCGRLPAREVPDFLASLDALIVPSRWEPFGYVALEALRCGVPPLVSRRGGMPDIVGAEYRYQFDPYDEESFAETIRLFQNDSAETVRHELEAAIRRSERLTAERMAEGYERMAEQLRRERRFAAAAELRRRYAADSAPLRPLPGHASETPLSSPHE